MVSVSWHNLAKNGQSEITNKWLTVEQIADK